MTEYPIKKNHSINCKQQQIPPTPTIIQSITKTITRKQNLKGKSKKWVMFTYYGKETHCTTKLFNKCNVEVAYKTKNTSYTTLKTNQKLQTKRQA